MIIFVKILYMNVNIYLVTPIQIYMQKLFDMNSFSRQYYSEIYDELMKQLNNNFMNAISNSYFIVEPHFSISHFKIFDICSNMYKDFKNNNLIYPSEYYKLDDNTFLDIVNKYFTSIMLEHALNNINPELINKMFGLNNNENPENIKMKYKDRILYILLDNIQNYEGDIVSINYKNISNIIKLYENILNKDHVNVITEILIK